MAQLSILQGTHEGLQGLRSGRMKGRRLGVIVADLNPYGDMDNAFGIDPDIAANNPNGAQIYFRGEPYLFGYAWEANANYPNGTNRTENARKIYNISPGKAVGITRDGSKYLLLDATKATPEYNEISKSEYDSFVAGLVGKIKRQQARQEAQGTQSVSPIIWLGLAFVGYKLFVK